MSDRLAVMNEGQIEQIGAPQEVYDSPMSIYVADFLGLANLMPARVPTAGTVEIEGRGLAAPTGTVVGECTVVARPERLRLVAAGEGLLGGSVTDVILVGSMTHIRWPSPTRAADRRRQRRRHPMPVPGSTVGLTFHPTRYGSYRAEPPPRACDIALIFSDPMSRAILTAIIGAEFDVTFHGVRGSTPCDGEEVAALRGQHVVCVGRRFRVMTRCCSISARACATSA